MLRFVTGVVYLTVGVLAAACSQTMRLPEERFDFSSPSLRASSGSVRETLTAFLANRNLGRSGYACIDCHGIEGAEALDLRPAPRLTMSSSGKSGRIDFGRSINRCTERYLMRPGWNETTLVVLSTQLGLAPGEMKPAPDMPGRVLYQRACQHCHQPGLAGDLLGRPLNRSRLELFVRSKSSSRPAILMPGFPLEALTEAQFQALSRFLLTEQFVD